MQLIKADSMTVFQQLAFTVQCISLGRVEIADLGDIRYGWPFCTEIGADGKSQVCHGVDHTAHHMPDGVQMPSVQLQAAFGVVFSDVFDDDSRHFCGITVFCKKGSCFFQIRHTVSIPSPSNYTFRNESPEIKRYKRSCYS